VKHSAQIIQSIVDNEKSAFADMALLTVAGGLIVAGVCDGFGEGLEIGQEAISSGEAKQALEALVTISNG
jgi:anthranilate phosphoribosyltransferase